MFTILLNLTVIFAVSISTSLLANSLPILKSPPQYSDAQDECNGITPHTLAKVCNNIDNPERKIDCFRAGKDAYLNSCGLGTCARFKSVEGTINCVKFIRNSDFDLESLKVCDDMLNEDQTISCLVAIGYRYGTSSYPSFSKISYDLKVILKNMQESDFDLAEKRVKFLIRDIDNFLEKN